MTPSTSRMSARPAGRTGTSCATPGDGDFVLVTNNASDFRRLYAAQPLQAGLIILIPAVSRALQRKLFRAALDELAVIGEPVNRVLEVDLDGNKVTLAPYDWPPAGS
jgi:hypothetical protein